MSCRKIKNISEVIAGISFLGVLGLIVLALLFMLILLTLESIGITTRSWMETTGVNILKGGEIIFMWLMTFLVLTLWAVD